MKLLIWTRSFIVILFFFPLLTLTLSVLSIPYTILTGDRRLIEWCAWVWGKWTLKLFSIELEVQGLNHIPQKSCLFLFNHGSFVDIFALASIVPKLKFGAKIELYKIPVFGTAMRAAGMLPIARSNREEVIRIYQQAKLRTDQGEQFALAPEGSRHSGHGIGQFKSGPFIFAIQCGIPIVPVVIRGAKEVWPKGAFVPCTQSWSARLKVDFLVPISTIEYDLESRRELSDKVRELMIQNYS
ncbi:MAG: hypothetical protein BroJett040_20800 [Oligoflexia bacterium]|nr:MAG: hypothetical protein BroJett040_20800 [Oligoflexia bacterium]